MDVHDSAFFGIRFLRWPAGLLILALISGCDTFYYKMDHVDLVPNAKSIKPGTTHPKRSSSVSSASVHSLAIDAKQRVVFFTERDGYNVVCAEPSPDALSALSSNFSSSFQNNSGAIAALGSSISESASSIGLRTQSIQLLRDGMYRSCEAYAAGAITKDEYNKQQRRYQNLMLSLLAIEQLTGAVVAQPAGLGSGKASGSVGESANDAAVELAQAEKDLESAQNALNDANETMTSNSKACTEVAEDKRKDDKTCTGADADKKNVDEKQEAARAAELKRDNAKLKLQVARSSISSSAGGASVSFGEQVQNSKLTDTSAKYIAEATRTIVSTTLLASFAQEECTNLWSFVSPGKIVRSELDKFAEERNLPSESADFLYKNLSAEDFYSKDKIEEKIKPLASSFATQSTKFEASNIAEGLFKDRDKLINDGQYIKLKGTLTDVQFNNLVNTLIKNCANNSLSGQSILYTPQYPTTSLPLEILNLDKAKSLGDSDKGVTLQIIGGSKPYSIKNPEGKIEAELQSDGVLIVKRKNAPSAENDETTVFVIDDSGAHKDINILLPKASN